MNFKMMFVIIMILILSCDVSTSGNDLLDLKKPINLFSINKSKTDVFNQPLGFDASDYREFEQKKDAFIITAWSQPATPQDHRHFHTAHIVTFTSKNDVFISQFTKVDFILEYTIENLSERHNLMDIFSTKIFWKYATEDHTHFREIYQKNLSDLTNEIEALNFKVEFVVRSGITSLLNNEHVDNTATYTFNKIDIEGKFD